MTGLTPKDINRLAEMHDDPNEFLAAVIAAKGGRH